MLGLAIKEESALSDELVNTLINFLIIFGLALIPELIAQAGIPTFDALWHAFLVGLLAALVFLAGNRGLQAFKKK